MKLHAAKYQHLPSSLAQIGQDQEWIPGPKINYLNRVFPKNHSSHKVNNSSPILMNYISSLLQ